MCYKVLVVLCRPIDGGKENSFLTFTKSIGAANEEQAVKFALNALDGFIAEGVIIHAEVTNDEEE